MVALGYDDYETQIVHNEIPAFIISILITLITGLALLFASRGATSMKITVRDGFLMAAGGWVVVGCFSTLPYLLSGAMPSFVDAFFESMSGITTTGASVLTDLEQLPRGVMFWRCMTQWIGGMGIIGLFVAILPALGEGSHNLFRAEIPGGANFEKITPRIRETARALWSIYLGISVLEVICLVLAGMPVFDSICHAFTTVSTGGFSLHTKSIGEIDSILMQWIFIIFMLLGAINFTLHFKLIKGEGFTYWSNEEFRLFSYICGVAVTFLFIDIFFIDPIDAPFIEVVTDAFFQVATIITTTGYSSADYGLWSPFSQSILFILMFVGGCAGSTSGSVKVVRHLIASKAIFSELRSMASPREVIVTRIQGAPLAEAAIKNTFIFMTLFFALTVAGALILALLGADMKTAFSASLACISNVGPGLGAVGPALNYGHLPAISKLVLTLQMLMGRLELFGFLIFFMSAVTRRKS